MSRYSIELSIVLPCLNEEETLERCLLDAASFLRANNIKGELIVGDNGSTDQSSVIALNCGAKVVYVSQRGYGSALFHAIKKSSGKFIIMGDADGSYDLRNLMPILEELRKGNDLVVGNRFRGGIDPGAMPWKNRWIGNPFLSGLGRFLFRTNLGDFHCGLRGFKRESFEKLSLKCAGMEFASEMVIKASLLSMVMSEVPVPLKCDGRSRPSHLRPWRDGWRHLRLMLLLAPKWIYLVPGLSFILTGAILSLLFLSGLVRGGYLNFMAAGSFILIGFQFVFFSYLTKIFTLREDLLPEDPLLSNFFKHFYLKKGLFVGGTSFLLGIIGTAYSLVAWRKSVQLFNPSIIALVLVFQIILMLFFQSILGFDKIKEDHLHE